ncbi:MAG: ImmA/IrrE family metallo-endopeptidase [Cellulomonadaceae bacterium]|jgi:Zn-dependent peptidase ImmA (M78 family)|nr:ImmA/IrrE family metallo-endopeptidase [Cellulomonadaceae bacterium]
MTLPRGFKAQAERDALAMREEVGAAITDVLDISTVAEAMGAVVVDGADLIGHDLFEEMESIQYGVFSAATFEVEGRKFIVTNPVTTEVRRKSDIAHEIGHLHLKHELSEVREVGGLPFRTCMPEQEEQATAFGGTLLLPRETVLAAARAGATTPERLAAMHGVSVEMARFRLNTTGALRQIAARRR